MGAQKGDEYESCNVDGEVILNKIILNYFENIILTVLLKQIQYDQAEHGDACLSSFQDLLQHKWLK